MRTAHTAHTANCKLHTCTLRGDRTQVGNKERDRDAHHDLRVGAIGLKQPWVHHDDCIVKTENGETRVFEPTISGKLIRGVKGISSDSEAMFNCLSTSPLRAMVGIASCIMMPRLSY